MHPTSDEAPGKHCAPGVTEAKQAETPKSLVKAESPQPLLRYFTELSARGGTVVRIVAILAGLTAWLFWAKRHRE